MGTVMWIGLGQQYALASGAFEIKEKSTSIENCLCFNSSTMASTEEPIENEE